MRCIAVLLLLVLSACAGARPTPDSPPQTGVATAWVIFDTARLRGSGASGLADRSEDRPLTIDDPVRVASISKLVVGLGVMRLVEQGKLNLDADVSDALGWQMRNPAFPDAPITLRLLLSHRSSLKDDGINYVIPLGRTVRETLAQPTSFDGAHPPGEFFRYSNLNFPVVASVMERVTGERFDRLIDRLVLRPLGLDACFNWTTCSPAKVERGVTLYVGAGSMLREDLAGRKNPCPVFSTTEACDLGGYVLGSNGALFSPQGGLRASARDLARIGQLLLRGGHDGQGRFLSDASIAAMIRPAWTFDGGNGDTSDGFYCAYGLGVQLLPVATTGCDDDLLGNGRALTGHAGDAYGVRSGLWIDRERGVGIAYFAANNGPDPAKGASAYRAVEEALAAKLLSARAAP